MRTQFEELMKGLDEVESFLSGEKEGFKVHVPEKVDVKRDCQGEARLCVGS